jgi:hypothetical protein
MEHRAGISEVSLVDLVCLGQPWQAVRVAPQRGVDRRVGTALISVSMTA